MATVLRVAERAASPSFAGRCRWTLLRADVGAQRILDWACDDGESPRRCPMALEPGRRLPIMCDVTSCARTMLVELEREQFGSRKQL